jgi:hypothetical protein
MRSRLLRLSIFLLLFSALTVSAVQAQFTPKITVAPVWRPGTQLDSVDNASNFPTFDVGDDYRYIDVEVYLSGNVQFWATEITCTVNKAALGAYAFPNTNADPGDDLPMVLWGAEWGTEATHYSTFPDPTPGVSAVYPGFNPATGAITFTATRLGNVTPLGFNGIDYNLLVATLRFRVLPLATNTTSTLTCTPSVFLDRNGVKVVTTPVWASPKPANLLTGYTLSGTVKYQGVTSVPTTAGIGVSCDYDPLGVGPNPGADPAPVRAVTTTGVFTFSNLRNFGVYRCRYFGNITTAEAAASPPTTQEDMFLSGTTDINLTTNSYQLLQVDLRGGNPAPSGATPPTFDEVVNTGDLSLVTGNWVPGTTLTAFTNGDLNGDKKIDEVDLAIVGGSYNLAENGLTYTHMLFSLARDYGSAFPNSHIWRGTPESGAVATFGATTTRDFWPTLSPDGKRIAFVRFVPKTTTVPARYELFTANTATPTTVTDMTPTTFTQNAFAPSWSPDGQRIAFICSQDANLQSSLNNGYQMNTGSVCVVDSDGRNFRTITTKAKIYPPAWYNDDVLIYAGHPTIPSSPATANPVCADRLCYFDFTQPAATAIARVDATDLEFGGGTIIDMPVVRAVDTNSDGVADDYWLFYRFDNGSGDVGIRWTNALTYGGGVFDVPAYQSSFPTTHGDACTAAILCNSTSIEANVGYYTISQPVYNPSNPFPGLNIVYYRFSAADIAFYTSFVSYIPDPQWSVPVGHTVDGYVGNPTWSGVLGQTSDLHALRATIEWLP